MLFVSTRYNDDEYQPLKGFLMMISFMSISFAVYLINIGVREYIKIPAIQTTVEYFYMAIISFMVVMFFWTGYLIIKHIMEAANSKKGDKK